MLELLRTLFLDAEVLSSNVVRESELILKVIEKEGLQGVEGDKNRVVRHQKSTTLESNKSLLRNFRYQNAFAQTELILWAA